MTENIILKHQLREIEKIVCERKKDKYGKRNVLKGKIMISMLNVLVELKKRKAEVNLKKQKGVLEREELKCESFRRLKVVQKRMIKFNIKYLN